MLEDGSAVVLNRETLETVELNGSGAIVFLELARGEAVPLDALAERLVETFGIPRDLALRDAGELVRNLVSFGLALPERVP